MLYFFQELKHRNEALFYFSGSLILLALLFFILIQTSSLQVAGQNAWYKPFKFALSIAIYCISMAWYCYELPDFNIRLFNWTNILLFGFEMVYIALQASRGVASHFNNSTPFYQAMFGLMGLAATALALYGAYVGLQFFTQPLPHLPTYYVWSIRLGILIFVLFSLQGAMMGARNTHTVGEELQTAYLPILKWNLSSGDLRVAHFVGMHALQVLPLLAWYCLHNTKAVIALGLLYFALALWVLVQALQARPITRF